jgi:tetratricopeptide (TPR) repeat protein
VPASSKYALSINVIPSSRLPANAAAEAKLTKALSSVPDHARVHRLLRYVDILPKRLRRATPNVKAHELDRNLASADAFIGLGKNFGRSEEAEAHVGEALRLSPRDTNAHAWKSFAGQAKAILGGYEQAAAWFRQAIEANRNYPPAYFNLAAALAQLGRLDEAHSAVRAGLALNPTYTISRRRASWMARSDDPTYLAQLEPILDGPRKAGVPD